MQVRVTRHHDISCGHRVWGHENKCAHLHGHNYRFHFTCEASHLDNIGRVIDFGVIKTTLCDWLEVNWDHKFLVHQDDPLVSVLSVGCRNATSSGLTERERGNILESIFSLPFNPTAENLALHILEKIGPQQLHGTGVRLVGVKIEETFKCSASVSLYTGVSL